MANLSKLKRPSSLDEPPPLEDASHNLKASEIAPTVSTSPPRETVTRLRKAYHQIVSVPEDNDDREVRISFSK
jgi:hypothetical protein